MLRFWTEIQAVLMENPGFFSLADTPEALQSVRRGGGSSILPFELAEAVIKRLDTPVLMSGEEKPLYTCFSGLTESEADVYDFYSLLSFSSIFDFIRPQLRPEGWEDLRKRWEQAVREKPQLLTHFQEALNKYRQVMLVVHYDYNICGNVDSRLAARMDAQSVHMIMLNLSYLI
jgi:hypothetical protein